AWLNAAYLFAWPGLDARSFLAGRDETRRFDVGNAEWIRGLLSACVGLSLLFGVARTVPREELLVVGWIGMIGIILTLHFGLFQILSCCWRANGINAQPLMNKPLASTSISEFWGRRWNTAFRDLTFSFLFRPITRALGPRWGMFAGFVFSGLVHDLVI